MPSLKATAMAVILEDCGYHEDERFPASGARYWLVEVRGQRLYLADPQDRQFHVGDLEKVTQRRGNPPTWGWERGRQSTSRFNPSVNPPEPKPKKGVSA